MFGVRAAVCHGLTTGPFLSHWSQCFLFQHFVLPAQPKTPVRKGSDSGAGRSVSFALHGWRVVDSWPNDGYYKLTIVIWRVVNDVTKALLFFFTLRPKIPRLYSEIHGSVVNQTIPVSWTFLDVLAQPPSFHIQIWNLYWQDVHRKVTNLSFTCCCIYCRNEEDGQVIIIVLFLFVCQKRGGHETWPCGSFSVSLVSLCTSKKWNVVLLVLIVTVKNIFSCIRALMAIKREKNASHNAGLLNESIVTPTVCCSTDCVVSSNNGVLQECLCAAVFC